MAFVAWVNKFNWGKNGPTPYTAPIPCGYNIVNFDMPILRRYAKRFGQWDDKREDQTVFNQVFHFDLQQHMWFWCEQDASLPSFRLTELMMWLGMDESRLEKAHDALADCKATADIIIRLFKMERHLRVPNADGIRRLEMQGKFA